MFSGMTFSSNDGVPDLIEGDGVKVYSLNIDRGMFREVMELHPL